MLIIAHRLETSNGILFFYDTDSRASYVHAILLFERRIVLAELFGVELVSCARADRDIKISAIDDRLISEQDKSLEMFFLFLDAMLIVSKLFPFICEMTAHLLLLC